jgi:peptidyl-prolyl cis-trans isomerase C
MSRGLERLRQDGCVRDPGPFHRKKGKTMAKRGLLLAIVSMALGLLLSGCQKSNGNQLGGKELVKINNVSITLDEFRQISEQQPLEKKLKLLSEEELREFLENYVVTREVLYQEAKKKGLEKNREIRQKVEDFRRAIIIDALLEEVLKDKGEVNESEILKYYKDHPEQFTEPQEVRVRHILVASELVLQEVLARLARGESFEKLAALYNIDRTREDGGDLGYLRRGHLAPTFSALEEAAFSLRKKGDRSEVIRTPYGYHILQLEDKRGTALRPYEQVKEKIRFYLQDKKRQEAYLQYVKEAKARAKIVINERLWAEEIRKPFKAEEEKGERPKGNSRGGEALKKQPEPKEKQ